MDTNTASTLSQAIESATSKGLPIFIEVGEQLPQMAPVIARNAEGAVQVGKTALNGLKAAGLTLGAGVVFGGTVVLFAGGALGVIFGTISAAEAIGKKMKARRERLAREASEKTVMGTHAPQPA